MRSRFFLTRRSQTTGHELALGGLTGNISTARRGVGWKNQKGIKSPGTIMSLWRTYQGLSSKARLGVGVGLLGWGGIGLYLSDKAEERFGYTPSEQDRAALEMMKPKIHVVDSQNKS